MPTNEHGELSFNHTIQIAHRLYRQKGKCQQIHGHSMHVNLGLQIQRFDADGYALNDEGDLLEFGEVKRQFRSHLDLMYDHRLLLNKADPWAGLLMQVKDVDLDGDKGFALSDEQPLPGLATCGGDPSTENLASWIASWAAEAFRCLVTITLMETDTNAVVRTAYPSTRTSHDEPTLREVREGGEM